MIILDSDHISYVEDTRDHRSAALRQRLVESAEAEICVSAVSLEEHMRGWLAAIQRHRQIEKQIYYYDRLVDYNYFFARWRIQRFDERAANIFADLRQQGVRVGTQDLKIASICLANDALLLSRNLVDFERVPNLRVENWLPE